MELDIDSAFAELGLPPGASEREVKAAWRRLASQWHPDRNGSAAAVARMQRINRALDAIRQAGGGPGRPPPAAAAAAPQAEPAPPEAPPRPTPEPHPEPPRRPLQRRVRLTLAQAAFGCTRVLRGRLTPVCGGCGGRGHQVQAGHCPDCDGSGAVRQRAWFGWPGALAECGTCHGSGQARQPCTACGGSGKGPARPYQVSVRFPPGVRDGDLLSVPGDPGRAGAAPAEIVIRVEVLPDPLLRLDEDGTLHCSVPVDGFAWIAQRPVEVPTLDGWQGLSLPRGQLTHCLKGEGFPATRRGPRGDLRLTIEPVFPEPLSTDQQILIDQLIAIHSGPGASAPDPRLQAWQQAVRQRRQAPRDEA